MMHFGHRVAHLKAKSERNLDMMVSKSRNVLGPLFRRFPLDLCKLMFVFFCLPPWNITISETCFEHFWDHHFGFFFPTIQQTNQVPWYHQKSADMICLSKRTTFKLHVRYLTSLIDDLDSTPFQLPKLWVNWLLPSDRLMAQMVTFSFQKNENHSSQPFFPLPPRKVNCAAWKESTPSWRKPLPRGLRHGLLLLKKHSIWNTRWLILRTKTCRWVRPSWSLVSFRELHILCDLWFGCEQRTGQRGPDRSFFFTLMFHYDFRWVSHCYNTRKGCCSENQIFFVVFLGEPRRLKSPDWPTNPPNIRPPEIRPWDYWPSGSLDRFNKAVLSPYFWAG